MAIDPATGAVEIQVNAAEKNPVIFARDGASGGEIVHNGNSSALHLPGV